MNAVRKNLDCLQSLFAETLAVPWIYLDLIVQHLHITFTGVFQYNLSPQKLPFAVYDELVSISLSRYKSLTKRFDLSSVGKTAKSLSSHAGRTNRYRYQPYGLAGGGGGGVKSKMYFSVADPHW